MPRTCTVCSHPERGEIDRALVSRRPFRNIAQQFSPSVWALVRHHDDHLPSALVRAREAQEVAQADDLLAQVRALRSKAMSILLRAELEGDLRTALAGIREARACLELLLEVEGRVDRRPSVNLLVAPEWLTVRATLLEALGAYPDARAAVAGRLLALGATDGHRD